MPDIRTQTAATYALQYNNGTPIPLKDFSGLLTTSQIKAGEIEKFLRKNSIDALEFHEVTLSLPFPLKEPALLLFDGVMKGNLSTVFTTIFRLDANSKLIQSYELGNCKIVQIAFPPLDASAKDSGVARITLKPEHIDLTLGNNSRISVNPPAKEKKFVASNFRLTIDGVPANKVVKVSELTVCPHETETEALKNALDFIEFKTLEISIAESELEDDGWQKWLIDFVRNQQKDGRNGTLQFLAPDLKEVFFEISLSNIFIVSTLFHEALSNNQIARATLELMFDFATISGKTAPSDTKFIRSGAGLKLPVSDDTDTKIPDTKIIKPGK